MTFAPSLPCRLLLAAGVAAGAALVRAVPAADAPEAARVVVVANAADPDSRELAAHYAQARGIPVENIVALPMPPEETISWPAFVASVFNPLAATLTERGWIDAGVLPGPDECGRRRALVSGHRISYLVLMRGVPLRIAEHAAWKPAAPPPGLNPNLACNQASVDAELALLAASGTPVLGYVPNPLYRQRVTAGPIGDAVVRVARLDGPTPAAVRAAIASALAGERGGAVGRAYIDAGGPHAAGNAWLESAAKQLAATGLEVDLDRAPGTLPPLARFDAPVLYLGWYSWNVDGPFTVPGFRFPAGAIAVHIHSFSAQTLRTDRENWCGPLVARGAAVTLGNVFEPYLEATHHLDLFAEALLRGDTVGAAAYYALPALSWQAVLVGDPLYRPFARSAEEQWAERVALPPELLPYAVLRRARIALQSGRKDEALRLARALFRETPSVPIGVSVAQLVCEAEGPAAAVRALEFLALLPQFTAADLGAVRAAAQSLAEWGEPLKSLALYDKALASPPPMGEVPLLEEAVQAALRAGLPARAEKWQNRLAVLKPPPAAK